MRRSLVASLCLVASVALASCGDDDPVLVPDSGADTTGDTSGDTVGDVDPDAADVGLDVGDVGRDADVGDPDVIGDPRDPDVPDVPVDVGPDVNPGAPLPVETCGELTIEGTDRCAVSPGGDAVFVQGYVLGAEAEYDGGGVLIDASGEIACVGCDCATAAADAGATVVTCPDAVVSPGLINAHDHITYADLPPYDVGTERFDHRHDWRRGRRGHTEIPVDSTNDSLRIAWGELRQVLVGTTSVAGSGEAPGFLRNLDRGDGFDLGQEDIDYETFPLGDSTPAFRTTTCDYPDMVSESVLDRECFLGHVAEGIDQEARNEFMCLSGQREDGIDITEPRAAFVHMIALTAADAALVAADHTAVVWSPRSNISLYGHTTPVTMYHTMGVRIALGTDWTPSGSVHLGRELACADALNQAQFGGFFSDRELWLMATEWAAAALHVEDAIGSFRVGLVGDVAIYTGADTAAPYRAILEAEQGDVALVLRGGRPLIGDTAIVAGLADTEACEAFPSGICGVDLTVCAQDETGSSFSAMVAQNTTAYGLEFCGVPEGEPTCVPFRDGEFDGIPTDDDLDGDGVPNASDNCPTIFNAPRTVDSGVQSDADADGVGDYCDPCPLQADAEVCAIPDVNDLDGDGVPTVDDNCPDLANPDQEDADEDGTGDLCDACPAVPNPDGAGCPTSIYDIKRGVAPLGTSATVTGEVTAIGEDRIFMQVPTDAADYDGASESGIMVYVGPENVPPGLGRGDLVSVDGTPQDFFGQIQLADVRSVTIDATDRPEPVPIVVEPADIATDGTSAEAYEGVLVQVVSATVTDLAPVPGDGDREPTNEFVVGENGVRVNDLFFLADTLFVGDVLTVTGPLRLGNGNTKIEPRDAADVVIVSRAPAELVAFGPDAFIPEASTDASASPMVTVTLNRAAETDLLVSIASDDGRVTPIDAIVSAGAVTAEVRVTSTTATEGPVTLTATLGDSMLTTTVTVVDVTTQLQPVSASPEAVTVTLEATVDVFVTTDIPALTGTTGADLTVAVSGPNATAPSLVTVPTDTNMVVVPITGVSEGSVTVTVSGGDESVVIPVEVVTREPVGLVISEVAYDGVGDDDGKEWIELWNDSAVSIDLSEYTLGAGGGSYTWATYALSGTISPGGCFVFGGPVSDADNGNPAYDVVLNFAPDLQNSGGTADAIGLFFGAVSGPPVDAVIYGGSNGDEFIGPDGTVPEPHVGDASATRSIERRLDGWIVQDVPSPGTCRVFDAVEDE